MLIKEGKKILQVEKITKKDRKLIEQINKLPNDYWDFKGENTKEYTHGIHTYPAMMVSPISRNIINIVKDIQPVNSLFDPFAGSGTVLVEGMLNNIKKIAGNDINPLALLLCKSKTTPLDINELNTEFENLVDKLNDKIIYYEDSLNMIDEYISNNMSLDISEKKGWGDNAPYFLNDFCKKNNIDVIIPEFKNIGYWFKPKVIIELAIIKYEIDKIENSKIRDYISVSYTHLTLPTTPYV